MPSTLEINYYGYFTPFGGYGIANFNWVKHLMRQGVRVFPHGKFMPTEGTKEWGILNDEEKAIARIKFRKVKVGVIETTPFDFDLVDNEIKICNTMAENDTLGKPWVNKINGMDFVVVPNKFQKDAFKNSGVNRPIRIIPHGTETEKFPYAERPKDNVFTFGIVGWLDDRKGVFDVVRAFASEFDVSEPVRLILKSSNGAFGYYSQFKTPQIVTITDLVSPEKLNNIYNQMDCFVFPSKAEGIGQPPREAMATGLPCIIGNYSGLEDICDPEVCYPINPISYTARTGWTEQPGNWANYDIGELMYWMRYIYNNQKEAKEKGRRAAQFIREKFSWESAAIRMKNFLRML